MIKKPELLAPVGDFECLKAAVQNGADCIYLGIDTLNARISAQNFTLDTLKEAIRYCKIRGVKTNLTLNTLIKDNEIESAFDIAKKAYEYGIDAIIVQDLGLAKILIDSFPDLPIHGSTQMSIHNLQGVLQLQELGFKRVVLSRELSIEEIEYIAQNSDIEIECFIHGALCISYSGQCLFSSMIGGRSGNRGKCAQGCRLPYELIDEDNTVIDKGYLLSPRDLCGLEYLPRLINSGIASLKIEGRMKTPEYVATVTRIYRKYIDLATSKKTFAVDKNDLKELMQVYNRGNFSEGHLPSHPNKDLIFQEKSNNMGLFLGYIAKYNSTKGLITLAINEKIKIGDTISIENISGTYTISELMSNHTNIKEALPDEFITIGRMKGNIKIGAKVFKMSSKTLSQKSLSSFENNIQTKQVPLNCEVSIVKNNPISIHVSSASNINLYRKLDIYCEIDAIPQIALKHPLEKEKVQLQILKTNNTPYYFKNVKIRLDNDAFLPNIKAINELRRTALSLVEKFAISQIERKSKSSLPNIDLNKTKQETKLSLLLNKLNTNYNYDLLNGFDNIYIPVNFFREKEFEKIIKNFDKKFNLYIYLPTIIKPNYRNLLATAIKTAIEKYNVKGFVVSNISNIKFLNSFEKDFEFIGNYTLNVFNKYTINELNKLKIFKNTISPELDASTAKKISNYSNSELIVYGKVPLMNMSYCPLGKSNKCYPTCDMKCRNNKKYYLKDKMNFKFEILPDNVQTVTTLYNSKITSISPYDFPNATSRIDILDESIEEIQEIINIVKSGNRFGGQEFTNGNLNKLV